MTLVEGVVSSVNVEKGVPICEVEYLHRTNNTVPDVPVMRDHHGMYFVPEEGQKVQMVEMNDKKFIIGVLARGEDAELPDVEPGEMAIQLDGSTRLTFVKNDSNGYDAHIEASGELHINADGNVYIDGIDFDQHTHDYQDSTIEDTGDGSGSKSSTTKSTAVPE